LLYRIVHSRHRWRPAISSTASIASQIEDFKINVASKAPPEIGGVFSAEQSRLAETTDTSGFAKVGERVAEFELPAAAGGMASLTDLLSEGPAVIVFYRGAWCPYCNIALATYNRELVPELTRRGIAFAAISPQLPDGSLTMKEKHDLAFPVLSDVGNVIASKLGIVFASAPEVVETRLKLDVDLTAVNGQEVETLPMPTVLLVDTDRTIRFIDVQPNYTERTEAADILAAADALIADRSPA